MKRFLTVFVCLLATVSFGFVKSNRAPGVFMYSSDTATIDGHFYSKGAKYLPTESPDSVEIRRFDMRRYYFEYGRFAISNSERAYPADAVARSFVAKGIQHDEGKIVDTLPKPIKLRTRTADRPKMVRLSTGNSVALGQQIILGKGSNADGSFRFVRYFSKSAMHMYSEETWRRALNTISYGDADLKGAQLTVHYIVFSSGRKKVAPVYWAIYIPKGNLFRIEIELEEAIKAGELLLPEASGTLESLK